MKLPSIAIISPNTLAAIGLADIVRRMMPRAEVCLFSRYANLADDAEADSFFHYFVSIDEALIGANYFLQRQHKTIILVHGDDAMRLPQGFHTLNVLLPEEALIRSIISLAQRSHSAHGQQPEAVKLAQQPAEASSTDKHGAAPTPHLTPRETDVLRGIVNGLLNKEIADTMGVSLATVITHRNNLTEKLGTRSVSALTIFAMMHGIVSSEEMLKQ